MTARTVRNLIDGAWVESVSGRTLERRNPADVREVVSIFPESDAQGRRGRGHRRRRGLAGVGRHEPRAARGGARDAPPASWSGSATS